MLHNDSHKYLYLCNGTGKQIGDVVHAGSDIRVWVSMVKEN
jgi:hypothetical protein